MATAPAASPSPAELLAGVRRFASRDPRRLFEEMLSLIHI